MSAITQAAIRSRPGMFIGDVDGSGVVNLVLEVVANAVDQHLAGRCATVTVRVDADLTVTVEDDGPGMSAAVGDGRPPLVDWLRTISDRPTVDGHRPHVHLGLGGMGLAVVNALSERFEVVTVRGGVEAAVAFARGELVEPLVERPTARPPGTRIRFRPDLTIFTVGYLPYLELTRRFDDLAFVAPRLALAWTFANTGLESLASRIAAATWQPVGVAHHRGVFGPADAPIDVEVALAWTRAAARASPVIHSFVNLERTRGDGQHVEGLLDGLRRSFGNAPRAATTRGLVAGVAVILADVTFGNPTKNRLETAAARPAVAAATRQAIAAWAAASPVDAAWLRAEIDRRRRRR